MADAHYFSSSPAGPLRTRAITVELGGRTVDVETAGGVFSPEHVDQGTLVLLRNVPAPPLEGHLLDVGCGWGPVALDLAMRSPSATVWAVDVNERALELTRANARSLGLENVNAVLPEDVPADLAFATVWSNPPIRVGKEALHGILAHWLPRLASGADAWLVVQRNLGSDSLQRWLVETMPPELETTRAASDKGFRVLRVHRGEGA
ncbi:methyltransferase [Clavibacter tessellarius]|uniref:MFS transporter n=1 Tax=Clavibacter tessellarius TaxID=31965 RepID=A0A225CA22_9MICO|nr:methyltransferase [Clavibacter michiganensis]OQJ63379.1 MFS transporter [Clavibacter michiganensis subsp. tessellarius]UKF33642.1 methyltransferase [Clavibacter michiganensis subsp. tessellarius]